MAAPRLFGEQRVPIASWARGHDMERPYVPGRNRYHDDDFQPAHVGGLGGSDVGSSTHGDNYAVDSGRGPASRYSARIQSKPPTITRQPATHVREQTPLTLDALKVLEASSRSQGPKTKPAEPESYFVGVPGRELMPVDAMSVQSQSSTATGSCRDWQAQTAKVFKQKSNFDSSVRAWADKVRDEAQWEFAYFSSAEWVHEDMLMDPATGTTSRAPDAPLVLLDEAGSDSESMQHCRATQTTNSVCAMKMLQCRQPMQLESRVTRVAHVDRVPLQAAPQAAPQVAVQAAVQASMEASPTPVPGCAHSVDEAPTVDKVKDNTLEVQAKTPDTKEKDTVHLCEARESDIDAMLRIYNEEAVKGTQARGGELATAADFASLFATSRAARLPLIVALVTRDKKREIVGLAYLSQAPPTWKNAVAPAVEPKSVQAHVYVRMRYRGRGIGSMLMSALMGAATQPVTEADEKDEKDKIEFVTVEVMCGSENGVMEREYERVLTQSFGFHAHPGPCDTMHWSKKTCRWLKTLKFYYACQKGVSTEDETEAEETESVSSAKLLVV